MPKPSLKSLALFVLQFLLVVGGLWWIWFLGGIFVGFPVWAVLVIVLAPPLVVMWLSYFAMRPSDRKAREHLYIVLLATAIAVPLAFQPWNPRAMFVLKLASLRCGMVEADVGRTMRGYLGGEPYHIESDMYVPDELVGAGVTHIMSYRWNDVDGRYNADIGQVFLRDGRVVGTRFMPD